MQTAVFCNSQCLGCKHVLRRQQVSLQSFVRAQPSRLHSRTRRCTPQALTSTLALDIGSPSNFQAVTNIVSALLLGAGAWWYLKTQVMHVSPVLCCYWVSSLLFSTLPFLQKSNTEGQQICPKCHGSGVVECFCQRWSDNDVGCGTCGGSGKMICNSCNGGGTAVPIEVKVHIQPRRPINDSYLHRSSQTHNTLRQKQHMCTSCGQLHCHSHAVVT